MGPFAVGKRLAPLGRVPPTKAKTTLPKKKLGNKSAPTKANKAAPAETPIIPGSAIGLRKAAWKKAPLTDNIAPAIKAVMIRGRRMLKRVLASVAVIFKRLKWLAPLVRAIHTVTTNKTARTR